MRGQKEKECLDIIIKSVFYSKEEKPCRDFDGKTYLDVSDEQFLNQYLLYIDISYEKFFGLIEDDIKEFVNIIRNVKPNENASEFPDFVFDNGFIEHFQITSSKETRKGAIETREQNQFTKKVESETKLFMETCNQTPSFDKARSKSWERENCEHNYSNLVESFKRNFEHHINSLDKYNGNKAVGIFMIENSEFAMSMMENVYVDWIDGMSQGDLREQQTFNCYRLSRDKTMLNYLYNFRDKLKYVIYIYKELVHREGGVGLEVFECNEVRKFEVIKIDNIPYLLQLLPWDFVIAPMYVKHVNNVSSIYNISPKADNNEESNDET